MSRTLIGASVAALLVSSALAQQAAPPPPTEGNIPPAANATMEPIPEPFDGDANRSQGEAAGEVEPVARDDAPPPPPTDTPSAGQPTEGTGAPPVPNTGPDAVPERADGAAEATSLPEQAERPGCEPTDGPSVSETQPVEGEDSGTAPGGSGSSGWTGGLGGSNIGTSQAEPLPSSVTQAPHPEVAGGLDPISGETAVTGPASPPPPAPAPVAPEEEEELDVAQANSPSGEDTPSAEAEIVPPATNARTLQQPGATGPAGADPC